MTNIGVTLTADDQQLIAILNRVEGKLDSLGASSTASMNRTSAATAGAAAGIKNLEAQTAMSARAMNAALRGVPAQFTDIVTSLQGGQAPLTVLLQQGGQLKDMFGGIIPAARALGGYVMGLVNPYTLLATAVATVGVAFMSGREESARTQRALIMSGDAAGVTADQMGALAANIDQIGGTQSKAAEVLLQMAAAGVKGAAALQSVTSTAIQLERAGGPAVEETVKRFAALGKDPVEASLELNKTTNFLTLALFEQIRALQEQGKASEAATLAQTAFDDAMKKRIPEMEAQLNGLGKMWRWVADQVKEFADEIKGIGRVDSLEDKLKKAQRLLETSQNGIYSRHLVPERAQVVEDLKEQLRLRARGTVVMQEQNDRTQAAIKGAQELAKANDMAMTGQQKMIREVAAYAKSVEAVRAGGGVVDGAQVAKVTAAIVEKYREKKNAIRSSNQEAEREIALMLKLSGFATNYASDAASIDSLAKRGLITRERALALQRELLDMQPGIKAAAQAEVRAMQDAAAAQLARQEEAANYYVAESKAREQASLATYAYSKSVEDAGEALNFETSLLGLTRDEREKRIAQYKIEIALREKLAAIDRTWGTDPAADMERARVREAAAKEIAQIEGRAYLNEWQRIWETVADGLSEALIQGFKGGASGAADFKRTIERMLRTVVIKPMVDNAVKSILGSVQLWVSKAFSAAGSGSGGVSGAGLLQMLFGNSSGGLFGSIAQLFGSSGAGLKASNFAGTAYANATGTGIDGLLAANGAYGTASGSAGAASGGSAGLGAAGYAAIAYAAYMRGSSEYAKGWTAEAARRGKDGIFGGDAIGRTFKDLSVDNILNSLGKKLGMSDKWASILSGSTAIAQLIGRQAPKVTGQGITGTLGGDGGASLQTFQDWLSKGGWFRRDKGGTNYGQLEAGIAADLVGQSRVLKDAVSEFGKVLGLPVDKLGGITTSIRVNLTGKAEDDIKAVEEAFKQYQTDLFASYGDAVAPFRKMGEDVIATVTRLAELQTFTNDLNSLGGVFSRLSGLSVNARESFIGMVGGMEALRSQAKSFVENFYSREEVAGVKAREIQDALRAVGITGDVSTREQFRALVEGADINTEAGRLQLATLLQAQGSFVDVSDYLQEVGGTLSSIAAQAPQMGAIGGILSAPEQAQLDAINSVTSAVNEVRDAIIELGGQMSGTPQTYPSSDWEVTPPSWSPGTSDGP